MLLAPDLLSIRLGVILWAWTFPRTPSSRPIRRTSTAPSSAQTSTVRLRKGYARWSRCTYSWMRCGGHAGYVPVTEKRGVVEGARRRGIHRRRRICGDDAWLGTVHE